MISNKNSKLLLATILLHHLLLLLCSSSHSVQESEAVQSILSRLDSKQTSLSEQESAAKGVLQRLLPTHLSSFQFKIITKVISYAYKFLGVLIYRQLSITVLQWSIRVFWIFWLEEFDTSITFSWTFDSLVPWIKLLPWNF